MNKMSELISVIIPVYNAEKYIKRCCDSILKQKGAEFEIIIIDDGSQDHSLEICRKLEAEHEIITVYHTENKGVSHARNFGMEKASGKWIVFVDADDELVEDVFLYAIQLREKTGADTVCWNIINVKKNGSYACEKFRVKGGVVKKEEMNDLMETLYDVPSKKENYYGLLIRGIGGKLLSGEIIKKNNIKFPEDMAIGEDAAFLFEYFYHCEMVAFLNKHLYKYYDIGSSVTKKYKENYFSAQKREAAKIKKLYKKYKMDSENALVHFWNVSFMTYIENELKVNQRTWTVIQKADKYLKDDMVNKYIVKKKSNSKLSILKSFLIKYKMNLLVACIYVYLCKKMVVVNNR